MTVSKFTLLLLLATGISSLGSAFRLMFSATVRDPPSRGFVSATAPLFEPHTTSHHRLLTRHFSTTSPDDTKTSCSVLNAWEEAHHGEEHAHAEEDTDQAEEEEDPLVKEYQQWNKAIQKALKALEKKQTSLENEWSKAQKVEETVARAQLIVNNLYLFNSDETKYRVVDWEKGGEEVELSLDPQYDSASAEADALFAQARKSKRGSKVVQELLEQVDQARQVLQDCKTDLQPDKDDMIEEGRLRLVQDRLRRTAGSTQFKEPTKEPRETNQPRRTRQNYNKKPALGTPASNVRKLLTPAGATVLVGRNRRGNEYLSLTYARGNDVWMHARGTPGAHVLVLDRRGSVHPTEECLEFAAHLAAFYSDGRTEIKVPVTLAEPKHIIKPRGAPLGAVKLRQEGQVLYGCPEMVPAELVEARAQSGVYASEEYRSADKAKHRKQTKRIQMEKQKQKRRQLQSKKRRRHGNSGSEDE